jgi:hypothetical protein
MTNTQPEEISKLDVATVIRMGKKRPLAIRRMHWINVPVLFPMIWSGIRKAR